MPRGRPPINPESRQDVLVRFRAQQEVADRLERAAAAAGETLSAWARRVLLDEAGRILGPSTLADAEGDLARQTPPGADLTKTAD